MRKHSISAAATVAALSLVLVGGAVAYADTTTHSFDDMIPEFQQSHYLPSWSRSTSSTASKFKTSYTFGNQLVNVKAQNLQNNKQYTELKGISPDNSYKSIANSTPAGQQSRLIVTAYDYNAFSFEAKGSYIIN